MRNIIAESAIFIISLVFVFAFSPDTVQASGKELEKALQKHLQESRLIVGQANEKVRSNLPIADHIAKLKEKSGDIRQLHLLLEERFRNREAMMPSHGKAAQRQREVTETCGARIEEYLGYIDSLIIDGKDMQIRLDQVAELLDRIIYKKSLPIHGNLPYRHLNYASVEPNQDVSLTPAYKGGNRTVGPDDMGSTEEAPVSAEIAELAESLNWNPVSMYEYVKNTVETEWYWGCMKGAEETLHQKSGNDCDQAALLVALLRASGFPSRYVRGTIAFFAGGRDGVPMERARNLLGIDDPWKMAEFFQKAGVPFRPVIAGGNISNFQIEHIWVESEIPYANYRGVVIDGQGKTWLGLDTSIKVKGYQYNTPDDIFSHPELVSASLLQISEEYLSTIRTETPLEYLEAKLSVNAGQKPIADSFKLKRSLISEVMNILPASMQFEQKRITHEYTEIPDELKHKVRFAAVDVSNKELFDITIDTMKLSNQKIALSYEPETVEDQQIIDSYGGLDNTPAYLVRLRPVLKVGGERIVVAGDGLPMGADYKLVIELISSHGIEKTENMHIAGNLTAIGIVAQKTMSDQLLAISEEDDAETILFKETQNFIKRWNDAEEELASLLHLNIARPVPSIVTIGGVIDVTYVLDTPHGYEWKGAYCDANLRAIEVGTIHELPLPNDRQKTFMELSALQGSMLEHRLFEADFHVPSVSTANLFQYAESLDIPLVTIDRSNVESILQGLALNENIKDDMHNSVNRNFTVRIPQTEITYDDWTGIGYIKENAETKEAGYMLSGMIAGGMTAVAPYKWSSRYLAEKLGNPFGDTYTTIRITSPQNGTSVAASHIQVSGIVIGEKVKVLVNGTEAAIDGNMFTASGIEVQRGINAVTAIAVSKEGKETSCTIIVKYELPTAIHITFPYQDATLSETPIDVEGIVIDLSATVKVNNISAAVSADGRFIAHGVPLTEGTNQITAFATNTDGKTGTNTITVNYKVSQVNPITITITSPENNATINRQDITVRGTVTTEAEEVSIKVNGIIADVFGNRFVANNVLLYEGNNVIIVNALGSNGAAGRAEITVNAITNGPSITLISNITSGTPPFTSYFSVSTELPNSAITYQMDFEGDGIIDYTGETFEDINYTYTTEGMYYPTITITDDQGNTYSDTIAVTVLNKAQIDALLKSKWEGMKGALAGGEVESALRFFIERSRERYKSIFDALKDQLPTIFQTFIEFNILKVFENIAEYEVVANENGNLYSYPGVFLKGGDGIWRFKDF